MSNPRGRRSRRAFGARKGEGKGRALGAPEDERDGYVPSAPEKTAAGHGAHVHARGRPGRFGADPRRRRTVARVGAGAGHARAERTRRRASPALRPGHGRRRAGLDALHRHEAFTERGAIAGKKCLEKKTHWLKHFGGRLVWLN